MHNPASFVCVFNRNRDGYQVPLALEEAGVLGRLVTDFYAPAGWLGSKLPGLLRRRRVDGLPRSKTYSDWLSFLVQVIARVWHRPMDWLFPFVDGRLSRAAGRIAARRHAALYCYHSYIPDKIAADTPLVLFVFHPLPRADFLLLEADNRVFPETAQSFAEEHNVLTREDGAIDWTRPNAVVCASSFTARSVLAEGCAPEKIVVFPYGLSEPRAGAERLRADGAVAEFLFVGQGVQRKGLHHLIRSWQANPPAQSRLTIVSSRYDEGIVALINDPSIRLLGYQSRERLDALFEEADVFVMPSLVEGFGLVYGEALSQGCHVIGTPNTGLPDLKLSADAVSLVEPGDISGLNAVLQNCAARAQMGGFDRAAIAREAAGWSHADFRAAVGAHAAGVLAAALRR